MLQARLGRAGHRLTIYLCSGRGGTEDARCVPNSAGHSGRYRVKSSNAERTGGLRRDYGFLFLRV